MTHSPLAAHSGNLRRSQLAVATLFLVLGFNFGTWASRIPDLKLQLGLTTAEVGFLLLASGLGAVFSFPLTAKILQRYGAKTACLISCTLIPLVLLGLAAAPSYSLAIAVMAVEGVLASLLNVGMNAQGVLLEATGKQAIMSRLHAVFSLGGLLAALFASGLSKFGAGVWPHFLAGALILWAAVAVSIPHLHADQAQAQQGGKRFALPTGIALWLGLMALFGTIVEGSMSDWSALYLKEETGASAQWAPLGIAFFSVTMFIARWFGDQWRTQFGAARLLLWGGSLAGGGLLVALLIGGMVPALLGFALVGIGMAAVSPCVYAAAAQQGAVSLAAVTTMGSIGALMGPPVIGFVAHHSSMAWGMAVVGVAALLIAVLTPRIRW
ncbi:MFS transporter [Chitinibacter tainanensis]|uniref:MFS transporter n=1 Tax=Chitinibacter tainanensis TaxID=230667 RepID=UPI00049088FE|nr:MFS transporter [Chitinibacter tainanensis]